MLLDSPTPQYGRRADRTVQDYGEIRAVLPLKAGRLEHTQRLLDLGAGPRCQRLRLVA